MQKGTRRNRLFFSRYATIMQNLFRYMPLNIVSYNYTLLVSRMFIAQSAGVVEHTDFFSAEDQDTPTSVLIMTLKNLMVRFQ